MERKEEKKDKREERKQDNIGLEQGEVENTKGGEG